MAQGQTFTHLHSAALKHERGSCQLVHLLELVRAREEEGDSLLLLELEVGPVQKFLMWAMTSEEEATCGCLDPTSTTIVAAVSRTSVLMVL